MVNLDWNIGNVNSQNDALISGAFSDIATLTSRTAGSVFNTVSPSALAVVDNTGTLLRKPWKTVTTGENYGKLAKTIPAIPFDIAMKGARLPVSFVDNLLNYGINNNLERGVAGVKALTTDLVANLITNNGQTRFKVLRGLGALIEGTGDAIGTIIKTPTGALAAGTSLLDGLLAKGTSKSHDFLNSVRITDKHFIGMNPFTNSADRPEAANTDRAPVANAA